MRSVGAMVQLACWILKNPLLSSQLLPRITNGKHPSNINFGQLQCKGNMSDEYTIVFINVRYKFYISYNLQTTLCNTTPFTLEARTTTISWNKTENCKKRILDKNINRNEKETKTNTKNKTKQKLRGKGICSAFWNVTWSSQQISLSKAIF